MTNTTNTPPTTLTAKELFSEEKIRSKFEELLGKRAPAFMTSVLQIVSQNSMLSKADPQSIYQAAAVSATLNLPLNSSLGYAYIVPYNNKQSDGTYKVMAQFQIGWRGFVQLAHRTSQFISIGATHITDKDKISGDRLLGNRFEFSNLPGIIIGYAAYFKLNNGFEKIHYMTVGELKQHGLKYSKTYANEKTKSSSKWETDFDAMANKTVLKLLLSKYAPLSIDMQMAVMYDQAIINDHETQDITYSDNMPDDPINKESERITLMIKDANTLDDLKKIEKHVPDALYELFANKRDMLENQKELKK
jgi:recombination protein RecT